MAKKPDAAPPAAPPTPEAAPAPTPVATPDPTPPVSETPPDTKPAWETFGWDEWDGSAVDPFPEEVRPWVERANGRYKKDHESRLSELNETKSIYDSIISEMGDPRVSKLEGTIQELESWKKNAAQNMMDLIADRKAIMKTIEEEKAKQAEAEVAAYRERNAWIFDGGEKEHAASELFSEGFDPEVLPEALKLPAPTLTRARALHKQLQADGVKNAGRYAIDLAKAEAQPPPPSESAGLISGAHAPNPGPTKRGKPPTDATLREKEEATVARLFQRK